MTLRAPLCALALIVAGCGDDATTPADGGSGDGSSDTSEGASTETSPADASTSTAPADATGDPVPPDFEFARGIRLERITANQAVQVTLVDAGVERAPEDYGSRMITGRRTIIRGFWSLHADFEPRELIGRMTIDYPDGTQEVQDFPVFVDGASSDGGKSFQWLLEPEQVVDGIEFRAKLLEPDPSLTAGAVSDPPPIAPLSGEGTLRFVDQPMELQIVLVPILHQFDGCEMAPEITDEDVELMRDELEQNNPVQQAVFSVREPMPYTESIGEADSFTPILIELSQTRTADAVADNVYYYGLIDSCDGFPGGLGGQAFGIPQGAMREDADRRVSAGRWNGGGEGARGTFVHEIGHSQGRYHVTCSGGEAGPDNNYPHPGGRINVWGFGIHDFTLRTPGGGRDYMTYCSNEFVSDYGWELTFGVIAELTSWDLAAPSPGPTGEVLIGVVEENGRQHVWTARGGLDFAAATDTVTLYQGAVPIVVPAVTQRIPHSNDRYFKAAVPGPLANFTAVELDSQRIDVGSIERY